MHTRNDTDVEQAEARLQDYRNAESRVLAGLVAEIDGRRLGLANLGEIQRDIELLNQRVQIARLATRLRRGRAADRASAPHTDGGMDDQRQQPDESPF